MSRLTADAPPVFVAVRATDREARRGVELVVLTEPPVRLTIDRLEPPEGDWGTDGTVHGFVSGGDRIVSYEWGAGRSGYAATWMWNLDDPCAVP